MTRPFRSRRISAKLVKGSNVQRMAIASPSVAERWSYVLSRGGFGWGGGRVVFLAGGAGWGGGEGVGGRADVSKDGRGAAAEYWARRSAGSVRQLGVVRRWG